jgi:uncharacterized protein (TIGR00730 family)
MQKTADLQNICVYCGSGAGLNTAYAKAASDFGQILAEEGIGLVYGGGSLGLMGEVSRSVMRHGGRVTGIIPAFLSEREQMMVEAQELIVVENMHQRKHLMFLRSDAFVALPGGLGTLEEFVEQLTWAQLEQHQKPVVLANIEGFWEPLLGLFSRMQEETFIRPGLELHLEVVPNVEGIVPAIRRGLVARSKLAEAEAEVEVTAKY